MPARTIAAVVTSISDGSFVDAYAQAMREHPGPERVSMYVVGDLNTPPRCAERVARARADGMSCAYLGVDEQAEFLRAFPALRDGIPWRSDNRRNVGYLAALRDGHDVIISIDDDNFPSDASFFREHAAVGDEAAHPVAAASGGWFNVASLLTATDRHGRDVTIFPRGFPYCRRSGDDGRILDRAERGVVGVNVGLWIGEPDVDAATRLVTGCITAPKGAGPCLLATGQRTPINSQNTAVAHEAIPAYYFVRMGAAAGGMTMDRYGDILSGYFLQLCAEAVGHRIRVGPPLAVQRRNPHDVFKDLWQELPAMVLVEELVPLLEQPLADASGYDDAYLALADRLEAWAAGRQNAIWGSMLPPYVSQVAALMRHWVAACRQLTPSHRLRARRACAPSH